MTRDEWKVEAGAWGIILAVMSLVIIFMVGMCAKADAATKCLSKPGAGYHAYRTIDDKKCWYKGMRVVSKSSLYWAPIKRAKEATKAKAFVPQAKEELVDGAKVVTVQQDDRETIPSQVPLVFATLLISNDVPVWLDRVTHTVEWPARTMEVKRVISRSASPMVVAAAFGGGVGLPILCAVLMWWRDKGKQWQFYWPSWWRVWPSYKQFLGEFGGVEFYDCVFSFSGWQFRWRRQIDGLL